MDKVNLMEKIPKLRKKSAYEQLLFGDFINLCKEEGIPEGYINICHLIDKAGMFQDVSDTTTSGRQLIILSQRLSKNYGIVQDIAYDTMLFIKEYYRKLSKNELFSILDSEKEMLNEARREHDSVKLDLSDIANKIRKKNNQLEEMKKKDGVSGAIFGWIIIILIISVILYCVDYWYGVKRFCDYMKSEWWVIENVVLSTKYIKNGWLLIIDYLGVMAFLSILVAACDLFGATCEKNQKRRRDI